ncbi:MAG: STT3 domain-containing protein [Candidatus Diapherotrites archaeon]
MEPSLENVQEAEHAAHATLTAHASEGIPLMEEKTASSAHHSPNTIVERLKRIILSKESLFVGLVFVLGFIVRAHLMRFELFFEFDSYWHARMVSYILQGLPAPAFDPLAYYQNAAAATLTNTPSFFWYVSAAIYKIFTLNGKYVLENWILWVKILPALYGALACVGMYFLGKELFHGKYERSTGLFAGILAAVVPAFVYRTMGGFFEDDSFGFLWMVFGLFFFVKAAYNETKLKRRIGFGVAAGICFGGMVLSWPGSNQLVPILMGIGAVGFLSFLARNEHAEARHFGLVWLAAFIPFVIISTIQTGTFWMDQIASNLGLRLIGIELSWHFTIILILAAVGFFAVCERFSRKDDRWQKAVNGLYVLSILLLLFIPIFVVLFNYTLTGGGVLGATIGEESQGSNYFGNKYSMLVVFALLGIPSCVYLLWKRPQSHHQLVIPLVWIVIAFILAWGKLKFTFYWGLPLALMGAVVLHLTHRSMEKRSVGTQKIIIAAIGFSLLFGLAAGIFFVEENTPNIESSWGWKTALFWSDEHLPPDAKFFNWWDEGHWITFLAQRGVIVDNRNTDLKASADVALFLITDNMDEAVGLLTKYGSTHLIFGDDLLTKQTNLGFYAYNVIMANDPRIMEFGGSMLFCSREETTLTKEVSYKCGDNTFTPAQMEAFSTVWNGQPTLLQGGSPLHLYRDKAMSRLYVFTTKSNSTMLVRLWFDDPTLEETFPALYSNTGGVRIWGFNPKAILLRDGGSVEGDTIIVDANAGVADANILDTNTE